MYDQKCYANAKIYIIIMLNVFRQCKSNKYVTLNTIRHTLFIGDCDYFSRTRYYHLK